LASIVLGEDIQPTVAGQNRDKFDEKDREAIMLLKLSVIDEMLPKIHTGKTSMEIWKHLKSCMRRKAFFLKNTLFSITMDESASL